MSLWSRLASDEQLEEVVTILAQEESEHRIRHLLRIFARRRFPNFENHSDRLLRLAAHDDWQVRHDVMLGAGLVPEWVAAERPYDVDSAERD